MLMKVITVLMFAYALTAVDFIQEEFNKFQNKHGKKYKNFAEKSKRAFNFKKNYLYLESLKLRDINHSVGVTKFFDMSREEFTSRLTFKEESFEEFFADTIIAGSTINKRSLLQLSLKNKQTVLPMNWDWRDYNVLGPIRDQSSCGGCWAFSTASNLESQYYLKYKKHIDISEQSMLNCDTVNKGCDGGSMVNAFKQIISQDGVVSETEVAYKNEVETCSTSTIKIANISSYKKWTTTNETLIASYLYRYGPLAVAVNSDLLQFYIGGVFSDPTCSNSPNHAVNLVGYGVDENGTWYWVVRNSWGENWGENGYFRIARGVGMCGINMYITTAFIA